MASGGRPAEWSVLTDQVILAHEFIEGPGPHPRGERLTPGRWSEQGLRTCPGQALAWTAGGHASSLRGGREAQKIATPPTFTTSQRTARMTNMTEPVIRIRRTSRRT